MNAMKARYTHNLAIDDPLAMERGGQVYYYHKDALGSVTALTDANGQVGGAYEYDSFGNITDQTGNIENPFTYTGREYDAETCLYYYRARYYDAKAGRFINEDPIGFKGGINFFSYVKNDPINDEDAFGLACIKVWSRETGSYTDPIIDRGRTKRVECGWREGDRQPCKDASLTRRPSRQLSLRA